MAELQEAHPAWEIFHNGDRVVAKWINSSPSIRLTAPDVKGVAQKITDAEEAWSRSHSYWAVIDATKEET